MIVRDFRCLILSCNKSRGSFSLPPTAAILVDGRYYFVGEKLGEGGFGAVYECSDEWSNQLVAKILIPRNQTYDQGLEYIHANGYVHKDMHPGNVFVSRTHDRMVPTRDPVWSFKIGDLGISPAEYGPVGRTLDIYHTGLLLLAIILRRAPHFTRDEIVAMLPRELQQQCNSGGRSRVLVSST